MLFEVLFYLLYIDVLRTTRLALTNPVGHGTSDIGGLLSPSPRCFISSRIVGQALVLSSLFPLFSVLPRLFQTEVFILTSGGERFLCIRATSPPRELRLIVNIVIALTSTSDPDNSPGANITPVRLPNVLVRHIPRGSLCG